MDNEIIKLAIEHYGNKSQIAKAIEEMSELVSELARYQNDIGMNIKIIEEIADVIIMAEQLKEIFGPDLVDNHIGMKLRRLKKRIVEMEEKSLK